MSTNLAGRLHEGNRRCPRNEKKLKKMEKETPDEMEMAEKKTQKGKAQEKSKKRKS